MSGRGREESLKGATMRIEYRTWDGDRPLAGKITLRPETPEEQAELDAFRDHVGSPQRGRKFEVVFRRRKPVAGPDEIHEALQRVAGRE